MKFLRDTFFIILGITLIVWSFYRVLQQPAPQKFQQNQLTQQQVTSEKFIRTGSSTISIEIATTDAEREQGLSGRDSLGENSGMLFVFPVAQKYGFWMKDMKFPLDIVWIDENWRVVGIESDLKPESFPKVFYPSANVKYVLELNSGAAKRLSIDTGLALVPSDNF